MAPPPVRAHIMKPSPSPWRIARPLLAILFLVAVSITYDMLSGIIWIIGAGAALTIGHLLHDLLDDETDPTPTDGGL